MSEQELTKRFGRNDVILLLVLAGILVAVTLFLIPQRKKEQGDIVIIEVSGREYARFPLSEERTVPIQDEEGNVTNTLSISDGKAKMLSADCKDQYCVRQKSINARSETIACLPNRVVVRIEAEEEVHLDSIAR